MFTTRAVFPPSRIPHRYGGEFFVEFIFYYIIISLSDSGSKTNGSRNEYETLTNLCIALLLLFIAWLTVLLIIFLYCRRYLLRSRPNRLVKDRKRVKKEKWRPGSHVDLLIGRICRTLICLKRNPEENTNLVSRARGFSISRRVCLHAYREA